MIGRYFTWRDILERINPRVLSLWAESIGSIDTNGDAIRVLRAVSIARRGPDVEDLPLDVRMLAYFNDIHDELLRYELPVSAGAVRRLIDLVAAGLQPGERMRQAMEEIHRTVITESEARLFFLIAGDKQQFVTEPNLFGDRVASSFPLAGFDIEEAGKSLAFDRGTACVFHLMRVLERGIYAIAHDLQIPNVRENWQNALDQIEKAIKSLDKSHPRRTVYSDAATNLMHIKDAWRNHTMHTKEGEKPTIYTEEKARQVFENVKAFMQTLAPYLSEKRS